MKPAPIVFLTLLAAAGSFAPVSARADGTEGEDAGFVASAEAAAAAYAVGDWATAARHYRALVDQGGADPKLCYNLGTTYAQMGETGRALWMLLRARRLAPREADINHNLTVLAPEILSQTAVFPVPPLQAIYGSLTLNEWAWIGAAGIALAGCLLTVTFALRRDQALRPWLVRLATAAVVIGLAGHAMAGVKYYDELYVRRGVVVAPETYPRAFPSPTAEAYAFTLRPGTVIRVEEAGVAGWVKAIYGGKNQVFILRTQMEYL